MHPDVEARQLEALQARAHTLGHDLTPLYFQTYHSIDGAARYACCRRCGRRISWGGFGDYNDALTYSCDADSVRAVEGMAWLTGYVPRLLLKRLTDEVHKLTPDIRRFFAPGDFDASNHWLLSDVGVWRLDWFLRNQPDFPVDEDNPQWPGGEVDLRRLIPASTIRAASYVGPRHNPNIGEDPAYFVRQVLETGTQGVAYQDSDKHWLFRSAGGVFGYYVPFDTLTFEDRSPTPQTSPKRLSSRVARVSVQSTPPEVWEEMARSAGIDNGLQPNLLGHSTSGETSSI